MGSRNTSTPAHQSQDSKGIPRRQPQRQARRTQGKAPSTGAGAPLREGNAKMAPASLPRGRRPASLQTCVTSDACPSRQCSKTKSKRASHTQSRLVPPSAASTLGPEAGDSKPVSPLRAVFQGANFVGLVDGGFIVCQSWMFWGLGRCRS